MRSSDTDEFVETRTQAKFNKFLQAGTVLKNYAHVLVLLLRLRQLTCHPSLITEGFDALAVRQEGEAELARAIKVIGQVKVDKIKADRLALAFKRIKAEKEVRLLTCPIPRCDDSLIIDRTILESRCSR